MAENENSKALLSVFWQEQIFSNVLGDTYRYLIGQFASETEKGRRFLSAAGYFADTYQHSTKWSAYLISVCLN